MSTQSVTPNIPPPDGSNAAPPSAPVTPTPQQPTSRLGAILGSVAKTVSTGLAGIPDKGRPSFVTGLGEGARSEKQAEANQQAIKFKTFDDQIRMAELHNQDIKMQNDTEAQQDAHSKAEVDMRAFANEHGVNYDTISNHGPSVMDHLAAQTKANGAASVPSGAHVSADGKSIYIPQQNQQTQDGQKTMYSALAPALGLPGLPPGADFVPPKQMNMLTNKVNGFDINGAPIKHEDLPGLLGATQTQRDNMAKNGASDAQLKTLDNMIGIYKANLGALDTHAAGVKQKDIDMQTAAAATKKQAELDVENTPSNQAAAARGAASKAQAVEQAKGSDSLVVAYHPGYENADGTKGANVVMTKEQAQAQGLQHYKADGAKLNATVAGMNDVQNKLNQLAEVATDPQKMSQVDPGLAARMLQHGKGLTFGASGFGSSVSVDTSAVNEKLYAHEVGLANQATRDFVTATVGAHEAVTQLPRLQTFGQSSRMTQQQMEAAQNLLPHAGDGPDFAAQKMTSLQGMLDPLRKQMPHMQGAEQMPSWLEKKGQQKQSAPPQAAATPAPVGSYDPSTRSVSYSRGPQ